MGRHRALLRAPLFGLAIAAAGTGIPSEPTPVPASAGDPAPRGYRLGLEDIVTPDGAPPSPGRFRPLSEATEDGSALQTAGDRPTGLALFVGEEGYRLQSQMEGLLSELEGHRWPEGVGRLEHHIAAEEYRVREGGLLGSGGGQGLLFDGNELARLTTALWRSLTGTHPNGAHGRVVLDVRSSAGEAPQAITVVPMTDGLVGDLVTVGCDLDGRCPLPASDPPPTALLVIGKGAAFIDLRTASGVPEVRLEETGVLHLRRVAGCSNTRARIVGLTSGAAVPVARWQNLDGTEWVRVGPRGLSLMLPVGEYRIETTVGDRPIDPIAVLVRAGTMHRIDVPPPHECR